MVGMFISIFTLHYNNRVTDMDISKSFLKKLLTSIVFIYTFGYATVTVDGYAYLENQSDHSGVTITFERTEPSALTETATTDANGLFTAQLETGIYDVTYSKEGFFNWMLYDQIFYNATTLDILTLPERTTLLNVPSVFPNIKFAIDVASNGDTILVQPGTYVENINYGGKILVVGSLFLTTDDTSYISQTIIDGNAEGSVVTFNNGENSTAVLTGLTITNGSSGNGGGIYCSDNSNPSLTDMMVLDNSSSSHGGGLYFTGSSPTLVNVTISGNSSGAMGGGIYSDSDPTLTNVMINGNSAHFNGGGLYFTGSSPTLVNVTISGNNADDDGGGIYCNNDNSPSLDNVIITNNTANGSAGGFMAWGSTASLVNVQITNNTATNGNGGGVMCVWSTATPTFTNVTITNNTGGGISSWNNASPSLVNTIVSDNTGNYGIYVESGIPTITYSDFYNNESGNFYNIGEWVGVNITTNANGDSVDAYGNIQLDPLFVDAANGDYNLQQGSPCIDAGDPTSPYDPDGSIADMGALPSTYGTYVPVVINVPTDYTTIQAALTAANATDTVLVQPGTYTENIFWPETNGIKLISAGDSSNTIIDGGGIGAADAKVDDGKPFLIRCGCHGTADTIHRHIKFF